MARNIILKIEDANQKYQSIEEQKKTLAVEINMMEDQKMKIADTITEVIAHGPKSSRRLY